MTSPLSQMWSGGGGRRKSLDEISKPNKKGKVEENNIGGGVIRHGKSESTQFKRTCQ